MLLFPQAMSCANLTNVLLSGKAEIKTKSAFTFENNSFSSIYLLLSTGPWEVTDSTRTTELKQGIQAFPDFSMNTKVHCIRCGKDYLYSEVTVVMFPDNDESLIMCKHSPECTGSLIDMMTPE